MAWEWIKTLAWNPKQHAPPHFKASSSASLYRNLSQNPLFLFSAQMQKLGFVLLTEVHF